MALAWESQLLRRNRLSRRKNRARVRRVPRGTWKGPKKGLSGCATCSASTNGASTAAQGCRIEQLRSGPAASNGSSHSRSRAAETRWEGGEEGDEADARGADIGLRRTIRRSRTKLGLGDARIQPQPHAHAHKLRAQRPLCSLASHTHRRAQSLDNIGDSSLSAVPQVRRDHINGRHQHAQLVRLGRTTRLRDPSAAQAATWLFSKRAIPARTRQCCLGAQPRPHRHRGVPPSLTRSKSCRTMPLQTPPEVPTLLDAQARSGAEGFSLHPGAGRRNLEHG